MEGVPGWEWRRLGRKLSGDGREEDGDGEEEAYGDLFGEAAAGRADGAERGVDEDEVGEEKGAEDEVEAKGCRGESWDEPGEGGGDEGEGDAEGAAVSVVEEVAGFEIVPLGGVVCVEGAGVK